jgi:hypothetical protein
MKKHRPCIARIDIDLATLVWTRGRDFEIQHLASRMKCIQCGSRLIEVQIDPMA